jgi:CheY-like chemotaxis protein
MKNWRILIVEDEAIIAWDLKMKLVGRGYPDVATAFSGDEAVRLADETEPGLILMDISLNGSPDGLEAALRIRSRHPVPVIFITGNKRLLEESGRPPFPSLIVLDKPVPDEALFDAVRKALEEGCAAPEGPE